MDTIQLSSNFDFGNAIALAVHDQIDEAIAHVVQDYIERPELRDGFACIANICYEKGHHEISLQLFEQDHLLNRLSPAYRQVYAYLLAKKNRMKESKTAISRAYSEDPSLMYGYSLVDQFTGKSRFCKKEIEYFDLETVAEKSFSIACYLTQQGRYNEAEAKIEEAYLADANLQDGYAFIGRIHRAFVRYEQALHYYAIDRRLERLTPASRIIFANLLTRFQRIDEAEDEVSLAYAEDNTIRDGFALIGSVYRNLGQYEEALPYYEKDRSLNRLSPANRHIFADQLARAGRLKEAEDEVTYGYVEDPSLRNGYARLGNILRVKSEFESALRFYERDRVENRLTPVHRLILAELLARAGRLKEAEDEVTYGYIEEPSLLDGYARLGNILRVKSEFESALRFYERDRVENRLTPVHRLILAELLARFGRLKEALEEVKCAYQKDLVLKDGHTRVARIYCLPRKRYAQFLRLSMEDQIQNRLTKWGIFTLAESYMLLGRFEDALPLLLSIEIMPPNWWGRAAQLWARSFQWPISPLMTKDHILTTLLQKHDESANDNLLGDDLLFSAITEIAVMRERIANAIKRMGVDLHAQIRTIVSSQNSDDQDSEPLPFLNSRLYYANSSDLFVLTNEIILSESDRFEAISDEPFIIDGGANIGTAIAYFKWLYPHSHIIAFEPNPMLFRICRRNIDLNGWSNVTLHPYALSARPGNLKFHCDNEMPMASSLTSRAEEEGRSFSTVVVESRLLGDFVDRPIDFLKLDIEGAESSVISSLEPKLSMVMSGIIEYHHGSSQNSLPTILNVLDRCGYRYVIKKPFFIRHITGLQQVTPRWSMSIFFKKMQVNLTRNQ